MVTYTVPRNPANVATGMDGLVAAAIPVASQLVSKGVKDGLLGYEEYALHVPRARFSALHDLAPDLEGLILTRQANVVFTIEVTAILGSCDHRKKRRSSKLKHCSKNFIIININISCLIYNT